MRPPPRTRTRPAGRVPWRSARGRVAPLVHVHRVKPVLRRRDDRPIRRDRDGVLKVCGGQPIVRDDRPAVAQGVDVPVAERDHRLDRQAHAHLQPDAAVRAPVVGDVGLLVHVVPDAVPHVLAHDAIPVVLRVRLDRVPDVTEVGYKNTYERTAVQAF